MGTWGVGLYQDDVACDVRDDYRNWLRLTQSNEKATCEVLKNNLCGDDEEDNIVWFALADVQWKYGRLMDDVKMEALRRIDNGNELKRWEDNQTQYKERKEVLEQLKRQLFSTMPDIKKVSRLVVSKALWNIGDVLLYQIQDEELGDSPWYQKYILLRVIGITKTNIGSLPREYSDEQNLVAIYNWVGDDKPDISILSKLCFIDDGSDVYHFHKFQQFIIFTNQKREKLKRYKVIFQDKSFQSVSEDMKGVSWLNISNMDISFVQVLDYAHTYQKLIEDIK